MDSIFQAHFDRLRSITAKVHDNMQILRVEISKIEGHTFESNLSAAKSPKTGPREIYDSNDDSDYVSDDGVGMPFSPRTLTHEAEPEKEIESNELQDLVLESPSPSPRTPARADSPFIGSPPPSLPPPNWDDIPTHYPSPSPSSQHSLYGKRDTADNIQVETTTIFDSAPTLEPPKTPRRTKRNTGKTSQFFDIPKTPSPLKRKRNQEREKLSGLVSALSFPPLSADRYGLIQEEFAHDPFQMLVAVKLLNRTRGVMAIPIFRIFIKRWPTPSDLADADLEEVIELLRPLGLQTKRAADLIVFAREWDEEPPTRGKRFRTLNYPSAGDGLGIKEGETIDDADERVGAFEIGHLHGIGRYALDSWRIFCRDELRRSRPSVSDSNGSEAFQTEWQRVKAMDKELRGYLCWMWLKEGFVWDPITAERWVAPRSMMEHCEDGDNLLEALVEEIVRRRVSASDVADVVADELTARKRRIDLGN